MSDKSKVETESPLDNRGTTRLDMATLEQRFATYPVELQEPCLWLGCYLRTECAGDLDILTARAAKLSITFDKTTFGRVIRGFLNKNAAGDPSPTQLVKTDRLLRAIKLLRDDEKLRESAGRVPFIHTTVTETIWDFITVKRAPDRVNKIGIIVGHTGSQKTAATKEYCRENNHGLCVHLDAPARPSLSAFIIDLAMRYNGVMSSAAKAMPTIMKAVNEKKTIVVENVQRLYDARLGSNQPIFSFLQKLQEETGCTLILTITPTFQQILVKGVAEGFFEQFIGRAGGAREFLQLPKFAPEEDVLSIGQAFGLQQTDKHLDYLVKISQEPGLIRILFEALQKAKILAGKKPLTIDHIRIARGED